MGAAQGKARCGLCLHFRNDRAYLETAMPGLSSMGSGDASARADDGVCLLHDRYLSARASCPQFASADAHSTAQTGRRR